MAIDAKEVQSRVRALEKAVENKESVENIAAILKSMQRDIVPTRELLKTTQVGKTINKFRTHGNKSIANLASEIVSKWRSEVDEKPGAKKLKVVARKEENAATGASPVPSQEVESVTKKSGTRDRTDRKPEEYRTPEGDGVDLNRTGDKTRDACIGVVYKGLARFADDDITPTFILKKAVEIEAAAFAKFNSQTTPEYRKKMRSLFSNLIIVSNSSLRKQILSGQIVAREFVSMSEEAMKSDERKKEDQAIEEQNIKDAQVPKPEKSISDTLTCPKCHKRQVSYSQAQTRSADEPMTTFCECEACGNRWKFS